MCSPAPKSWLQDHFEAHKIVIRYRLILLSQLLPPPLTLTFRSQHFFKLSHSVAAGQRRQELDCHRLAVTSSIVAFMWVAFRPSILQSEVRIQLFFRV